MLREFGLSKKAEFMRVSARKNTAIDEVFQRLGERLIEATPSSSSPSGVRLEGAASLLNPSKKKKRWC